jgi:hypothetical protein
MGVAYSYDPAVLRPLKSSSTWTKQGTTQAFDTANKVGVWMNQSAVELEGRVCSLAFQVLTEEEDFNTQVTVTLVIKNGGIEVGTYTANVRVYTAGEATEPEATEPEATEPETTEPAGTQPSETAPEAPTEDKKPTTGHDHDHDHSHDEPNLDDVVVPERGNVLQNILILLGIAGAVGIGIAVSRKKKR